MMSKDTGHIVLVAGLSGSGKSTFMRALADGALPGDIISKLDPGIGKWPQTNSKDLLEHGFGAAGGRPCGGIVVHYNMSRPFALGLADYGADKALAFLGGAPCRVTVVTVVADAKRLAQHLRRRGTDPGSIARETEHSSPMRRFRRKARALVYRGLGMSERALKKGQIALVRHYEQPGNVERWMDCWKGYLADLAARKPGTSLVYVTPDDTMSEPNFRLRDPL